MDITSCQNCGVVLNRDNIEFPEEPDDDDPEKFTEKMEWHGNDYVVCVPCPVCGEKIPEK